MTPTTPRLSRNASNSSPLTTIFFGGPSASGNSSVSNTGNQKRRSSSPIGVPAPLSVRNLLSSARSMAFLRGWIAVGELGAGGAGRQTRTTPPLLPRKGSGVGGASANSMPHEQADGPPNPDPSLTT